MKTPHISLRVPSDQLATWRAECVANDVDVSSQIRVLMDAWVKTMTMKREYEEIMAGDFS